MKSVQDILDRKGSNVVWIEPLESVLEAARLMTEHNVAALVVKIDDYLVGIVTERDYVRKVVLDHTTSKLTKISEIMTRDVIKVKPETTVENCVSLMREHHIRHLPVVVEGKVVGIVSLRDLFLEAIAPRELLPEGD
ncbi:MAG: CBS domain-containing protein [Pseudomonadales bacterium]